MQTGTMTEGRRIELNRITEAERKRFHKILDDSIDKMNSPKNMNKEHWEDIPIPSLQKMINVENAELDLAISIPFDPEGIETENYDLINLNMMMVDNIRNNE